MNTIPEAKSTLVLNTPIQPVSGPEVAEGNKLVYGFQICDAQGHGRSERGVVCIVCACVVGGWTGGA